MTAEDVERLPDDDHRYVLWRGVLYRMSPPGPHHGWLASRFDRFLGNFVEEHGLGAVFVESGWVLERGPDTLVGPDVSFVRTERLPAGAPWERFQDLAPDLAVEIVSPSETGPSVAEKVAAYLDAGVRMVVVVRPRRRTVTVHTPEDRGGRVLGEGDELDGGEVVPGFRLPLAELFG